MWSDIYALLPALEQHARVSLDSSVRPMESLPRLGQHLGVRLSVKRDDISTLAFGGNKVRQLEFYLAQAVAQNADTVLITGAIQSNFVRSCAAAAAKLNMQPVVQLEDRVPNADDQYQHSGNVLVNQLLGAEIHYFPEGENEAAADANLDTLANSLRQQGKNPFVIHLGPDYMPVGGLGYAACAAECYLQLQALKDTVDHVVIPSGSGLTHAGFLVGARAIGWDVPMHGVCVRRQAEAQHERISQRASELLQLLDHPVQLTDRDVAVYDSVLAPGYGQLNDRVMHAITQSARLEALMLDPVYSGRAMAGLFWLVEAGVIKPGESVLFIHTGGLPALFAYQDKLVAAL